MLQHLRDTQTAPTFPLMVTTGHGMAARFRLRELIEEAGLSQSELSRRSGVSFATINRLAQNATEQVSLKTLDRLSIALGEALGRTVEPGDLLEREPEKRRRRA